MELSSETEKRIIEAAEKVFYLRGKAGASMQEIADEADITRTSLNYYYRSKDKLFEAVFRSALGSFVPHLATLLRADISIREYLPEMITMIIDTMIDKPQIPVFVLQEISSNPSRMQQIIREMGIDPQIAINKFTRDGALEHLPVDPRQVLMNVLSLCIFPFAAKPIVVSILYGGDENAYREAMHRRKELLPPMILESLKNFEK